MSLLMTSQIRESELILNSDGSIYHLNLLPEDVADTVILVGDPNRVEKVSRHFDHIDVKKSKREFVTHTGTLSGKRVTVVGTGIGAGNIDITLNELDALVNIDLKTREVKETQKQLRIIRMGTSGALQEHVPVDSLLVSSFGIGFDGLVSFYEWENTADENALLAMCREYFSPLKVVNAMYTASASSSLVDFFVKRNIAQAGITLTCSGFYGAQNRQLRAPVIEHDIFSMARKIHFKNNVVTNLEMETAAIYGLSRILGHQACSISAIVANRDAQTFSANPEKVVEKMIETVLENLSDI